MWPVWGPILEPSLEEDTLGGLCCVDGQSRRSKVLKVEGEDVSGANIKVVALPSPRSDRGANPTPSRCHAS